jgi:hypothetical protein
LVLLALFAALLSPSVLAEIPNAGPQAYTEKMWARDALDFYRKIYVDGYREHGRHDPRWDDQVIAFLEDTAKYDANAIINDKRYAFDTSERDDHIATGRKLLEMGCDDPLVIFAHGLILVGTKNQDETVAAFKRAYEGLLASDYPLILRALAMRRYRLESWDKVPNLDAFVAEENRLKSQVLFSRQYTGAAKRAVIDSLEIQHHHDVDDLQPYVDAIPTIADPDPWTVHYITGLHEIAAAWAARGTGFANTVTEQGWKGFAQHLALARQHLEQAWQLDPSLPQVASRMIAVTMGESCDRSEERLWFNRSVSAQFDFTGAYAALSWALRPRWGGSHEEMFAFAQECAATRRYDTDVPHQAIDILAAIREDMDGSYAFYTRPEVWPMMREVLEGMADEPVCQTDRDELLSYAAAAAWRCEQFAEAKKRVAALGDKMVGQPWITLDGSLDMALPEIEARCGAAAPRLAQAINLARQGQTVQALTALSQASETAAQEPAALRYAARLTQWLRWWNTYNLGEITPLSCDDDLLPHEGGATPSGWVAIHGSWSRNPDGGIVGVADDHGLEARIPMHFGTGWELTGTIDASRTDAAKRRGPGIVIDYRDANYTCQVVFDLQRGTIRQHFNWESYYKKFNATRAMGDVVHFRIQRWNNRYTTEVDGQVAATNVPRGRDRDDGGIGVGARKPTAGETYLFRDLTIRQLKAPPPWYAKDDDD